MFDAVKSVGEVSSDVVLGIVGERRSDDVDALVGEEALGSFEEVGAGRPLLDVVDLGEREAAVFVNRRVHVTHALTTLPAPDTHGFSVVDPPATSVGNPTRLLHINVDKFAGMVGVDPSDHSVCRAIEPRETIQTSSTQHPMHIPRRNAELPADTR